MHAHGENRAGHLEFFVRVQEQIGKRVRCIRSVRIHAADQDVLTPVVDRVRLIRLQLGGEAEAFANAALLRRTRQLFLVFYIVFLRIELCAVVCVQCKAVDQLLRFFQCNCAALAVHLKIRVQNAIQTTDRDVRISFRHRVVIKPYRLNRFVQACCRKLRNTAAYRCHFI